jgi:PAS domain S-box-containing protein
LTTLWRLQDSIADGKDQLPMTGKQLKSWLTPFNIALAYTVLGGGWILFADPVMADFFRDAYQLSQAKVLNDWLFLVVSGQGLYWLLRHREAAIERSQQSLFRLNRALRVYSECNKAITWDRDEPELLHKICRILVMLGSYRLVWVGYAQQDVDKSVKPVASWGHGEEYLRNLRVTWDEGETGQGPAGTTIRTGKATVIQHIASNPCFKPWRDEALKHGFSAAISLPLRDDAAVFGVMVILAGEADAFNDDEVRLLEELTDDLSAGITTIRKETEQAKIKEEQLLLAAVIAQESEGVMTFDQDGTVQYVNPAWEKICGIPENSLAGKNLHALAENPHCRRLYQAMQESVASGETVTGSFVCHRTDGTRFEIDTRVSPVRGLAGKVVRHVAVIHDVTHEVQLEKQLLTAQKMEAIATLSGGIAHDFNNILAAIITNTELTLDDLSEHSTEHEQLKIVLKAALRGKQLVKQIKTISQQAGSERVPVRVENVVAECLLLLRATLPASIEIRKYIAPELGLVSADPTQLHQVILNLCTNAAEAMQDGRGVLEIRLEPFQHLAAYEIDYPGLPSGDYLRLTVTDTGHGMDRAIMERIFDPFFTTKGKSKGTGLGLSVVHSIVKSHGGTIVVDSEPGQGTSFKIFLPRLSSIDQPAEKNRVVPLRGGRESILLVDDEAELVYSGRKMLERLGYQVVTASDGLEAFQCFLAEPHRFDLVITDQTMPDMTGEMLAREMLNIRADLPIILCSGHGASVDGEVCRMRAREIGIRELIAKPFEREEMTRVIRRVLD